MRMLWNLLEGEACIDFQLRKKSAMCICTLAFCTALFDAHVIVTSTNFVEVTITWADSSDQGCNNVNETRIW